MSHLDDGTLQAFLDHELRPGGRAEAAEHLLACEECRDVRDELARANAIVSEAVASLDTAAPPATGPAVRARRRWLGGGSLVKAASLTLLLAAAASAAVPGSPVREWIVRTVAPPVVAPAPEVEAPAPTPVEPAPIGVSMLPAGAVEVLVADLDGTTIRLVETTGESVGVSALGAETDPAFRTGPGRIEVRGAVGGAITIELPRSLSDVRVVVDGEVYAQKEAGELRILVPAETADGARIWR